MERCDAYFAGLFDGEGTVGVYQTSNGSDKQYWGVKLSIGGTFRPMMEAVHAHFRVGNFYTQKRQEKRLHTPSRDYDADFCKQCWKWSVSRRDEVAFVLRRIIPYLLEKREQAEIALGFIEGNISGEEASERCKQAKQFTFPTELGEPTKRSKGSRAELNPMARLTYEQAEAIRQRVANGERQIDIAREMQVSRSMVSRIILGKTYTQRPRREVAA